MQTIKGPGIFLAQFLRDEAPYNTLESISDWVARLGYTGVQIPTWDSRVFDLDKAARSKSYCDDYKGILAEKGLEACELASYLQGQVLAMHPAYAEMFQPFYPEGLSLTQAKDWATEQLKKKLFRPLPILAPRTFPLCRVALPGT